MIRVVYGSLDNENGALVAVICTTVPAKGPERLTRSISKQVSYRGHKNWSILFYSCYKEPQGLKEKHCTLFTI